MNSLSQPADGIPSSEESLPFGDSSLNSSRTRWMTCGVLLLWGVLGARLLHIQWWQQVQFSHVAARQQINSEVLRARPGDIRDRRGRLLATTIVVPSFYADPHAISDPDEFSRQVANILSLDAEELSQRLEKYRNRRFLWIKRRLTEQEQQELVALKLPANVCGLKSEFQRHYPQGTLAAHVLGLRDIDGHGRGGIEQTFDEILRGTDGTRRSVRDARGYTLEMLEEVTTPSSDGTEVTLTLDSVIQMRLEQRLDALMLQSKAQGICGIVLDPQRGEVLAMASRPAFDPNHPEQASEAAWKNLCIAAVYEPGSTIKPLVVGRALDLHKIERFENLDCEHGAYRMGPRVLHDHHPYGVMSITDVLVKSSNIGMAKIGERLGNEELYKLLLDCGFGEKTGIELPGELPGMIRSLPQWNVYSTGSIPMGQELAVTPLQMLSAHAALASGGRRISPHLLMSTNEAQPTAHHILVSQVLSADNSRWLIAGPLVDVIERGTGTKARIPGLSVFGKTGTAEKIDPRTGKYSETKQVSSFVCGAPAESPQVMVLITVDEPAGNEFGGTIAAPAAADVLRESLQYLVPAKFATLDETNESSR